MWNAPCASGFLNYKLLGRSAREITPPAPHGPLSADEAKADGGVMGWLRK